MMGLQFALVARFQTIAEPFGIDLVLQFHRQIAYVALSFILAHPIILFIVDSGFLALLDPITSPWRARMAVLSTAALLALIALSIWRKRLRVSYELWQLTHGVLAIVVVVTALAHVFLVGYYVDEPWERMLWVFMTAGFVVLLLWVRVVRPLQRYRRAWRVQEVVPERGTAQTLVLEAVPRKPDTRPRFSFQPGQFAWIMAGKSPFSITQHPFSISSSAERMDQITLTIKAAGDFTSKIGSLQPKAPIYLDGPYGAFSIDRYEGPGFVLIGAGAGVTPLMSMMRTLADRNDVRSVYLFLCNRQWESITFREEIEGLKLRLALTVVHILSDPPEDWKGEEGHIRATLLLRHLPERYERLQYFICGPDPMMDAAERCLAELEVAPDKVHVERFHMA